MSVAASPETESCDKWIVTIQNKEGLREGVMEGDVYIETNVEDVPRIRVHYIGLVVGEAIKG